MLLLQIIIATTLVSAVSFIGIFFVSKKIRGEDPLLKNIISVAAGSLLAVSFVDLLPEAVEGSLGNTQMVFMIALASFLIFFILEKYWHWHHCRCADHGTKTESKQNVIFTNLVGDGIHNLTDGFLIATAFMLDFKIGIVTTIVVMLHEIPQEISDFGILVYAGLSRKKALTYNVLFALTSIVGGIAFYYFGQSFELAEPYMAAFAAGNFLYLAAADLIPELHDEDDAKHVVRHTAWLLLGVAMVVALNFFHPEFH